jgi:hypothetical protein
MVRLSKPEQKRHVTWRRPKKAGPKTGSKKDNLPSGFKKHDNSLVDVHAKKAFIPKIK